MWIRPIHHGFRFSDWRSGCTHRYRIDVGRHSDTRGSHGSQLRKCIPRATHGGHLCDTLPAWCTVETHLREGHSALVESSPRCLCCGSGRWCRHLCQQDVQQGKSRSTLHGCSRLLSAHLLFPFLVPCIESVADSHDNHSLKASTPPIKSSDYS